VPSVSYHVGPRGMEGSQWEVDSEEAKNVPLLNLNESLKPGDWRYKNEGGENIVLSYCGVKDQILSGKVLRVKKKTKKPQSSEFASYIFKKNIIKSLIGDKYIELGAPIRVVPHFLNKLNEMIAPMRPKHRLKHEIDDEVSYALLMQDLTMFPFEFEDRAHNGPLLETKTFTIEIKPKSGAMPTSPFIRKENSCKYTTCRYCMHQYLKLNEKVISEISKYCPLNLFSRDHERIRFALYSLLHSPQNNLKVYNQGNLCFAGAQATDPESMVEEVESVIKDRFAPGERDPVQILVNILLAIFLKEPILSNLQKAQRMDTLDIEAIYYLQGKLQRAQDTAELENLEELNKMTHEETRSAIDRFLTAATAKDCSIMITLCPLQCPASMTEFDGFPVIRLEGYAYQYLYRLSVVDVDPKSAQNIVSYYQLDQAITSLFSTRVTKTCLIKP